MLWNNFLTFAVHEEIRGFKHRLPDQDFVARDIRVLPGFAAKNFKQDGVGSTDRNQVAICEPACNLTRGAYAELGRQVYRKHGFRAASVHKRIDLTSAYLVLFQ